MTCSLRFAEVTQTNKDTERTRKMKLSTNSGVVTVNKKTAYGKWLAAYCKTGAWTGAGTIASIWDIASVRKPQGVTWTAWGRLCGGITLNGVGVRVAFCG